jgi:type III secretion protein J
LSLSEIKKRCRLIAAIIVVLSLSFISACNTELYSGLSEEDANLILKTLLERGVDTDKVDGGKNGYSIKVPKEDLVRSLEILAANGLPKAKYSSLGEIFNGEGMISSTVEEQSRLAFALSQELSETFSRIDGVLTARTHVVLASYNQATGAVTPASCAIFLRHLPDSPVINMTAKIREISSQSVPGLDYEKVAVMLVPVRESTVLGENSTAYNNHTIIVYHTAAAIVILFLIALVIKYRRKLNKKDDFSKE